MCLRIHICPAWAWLDISTPIHLRPGSSAVQCQGGADDTVGLRAEQSGQSVGRSCLTMINEWSDRVQELMCTPVKIFARV